MTASEVLASKAEAEKTFLILQLCSKSISGLWMRPLYTTVYVYCSEGINAVDGKSLFFVNFTLSCRVVSEIGRWLYISGGLHTQIENVNYRLLCFVVKGYKNLEPMTVVFPIPAFCNILSENMPPGDCHAVHFWQPNHVLPPFSTLHCIKAVVKNHS